MVWHDIRKSISKVNIFKTLTMITKIYPHPCLEKTVDYYWIEKNGSSNVNMLPDGTTSIIFNLGSPFTISGSDVDNMQLSDKLLIGTHNKSYLIKENKETHIIGVKFKQGGAYHLFKFPMIQFSNKVVNLYDILNGESEQLRDMLIKAESAEEVKKVLDYYLFIRVDMLNGASEVVDFVIKKVKANGSPTSIKEICQAANVSNKHLITLFKEKVGLSPKLIHRINKFTKVIELIQKKREVNWTEIAYECNYYDQAHLINEFKNFSGLSPKNYLNNENTDYQRVIIT